MSLIARAFRVRHWLRVQARDAVELFLLPSLAAVLPWSLCFLLYKQVARSRWLYRQAAGFALEQAQRRGYADDPQRWLYQRKLVTLVDHADLFLATFRSARWMRKYLRVVGAWPSGDEPQVLCTFHWGAGMWSLRHIKNAGLNAHILVASLKSANFHGRPVLHWYARWRTARLSKELGNTTIDASSSLRAVVNAMRAREQIIAVVDVPADAVAASSDVKMLGGQIRVPRGLLRVAADRKVAVTVFTVGIDLENGRRQLTIHTLPVEENIEILMVQVFAKMEAALRDAPAAWHFWGEADRFFV